ncbi:MAG: PRC-barrel domain-containing protein [Armatimonadia bacterium]
MREIKSITGLRVISVDEGASVGVVSEVVVDLAAGTVLGLILGNGAGERGVAAADIQTIGTDVIMISSRGVARHLSELPELEKRKSGHVGGLPVFTASGRRLGMISAIFIDPYEKNVARYEVSGGPLKDLADGILIMPIIPGTVHGQDAVIVPDEAAQELGREAGGLRARFGQWGDTARKQAQQVGDTARKQVQQVAESAEKIVDTSAETLKKEAAVVRERAVDLSAKAREAVTKLGEKEESAAIEAEAPGEGAPLAVVVEQPDEIVAAAPHEPEKEQIITKEEPEAETTEEAAAPTEESTES